MVTKLVGRRSHDGPIARLSAREREVLELMAEGRSNTAIAQQLFVTEKAVSKHTTSIFTKLGLAASEDDNRRVLALMRDAGARLQPHPDGAQLVRAVLVP